MGVKVASRAYTRKSTQCPRGDNTSGVRDIRREALGSVNATAEVRGGKLRKSHAMSC